MVSHGTNGSSIGTNYDHCMTGQSRHHASRPSIPDGSRILVTGASGFVGASLAIEAERRGYAVVRCGRARSTDGWVHHDCRDPRSAERLPLDLDAVVHCAGLAHRYPPNTPTDAEYKAINADAAAALAHAARGKARRFVLVSSVAAVGSGRRGPIGTGTIAEPETPYGRSKLLAERLVAEALAGSSTTLCILRFPAIHGPGAPGAVGHLAAWIAARRPLPSCCASVRRSLIGVDNAVDAALLACVHPALAGCTAMPTDGEAPSVLDLASRIGRILDVQLRTVPVPRLALRFVSKLGGILGAGGRLTTAAARMIEDSVIDDRTLQEHAHWAPPISLDEGLSRAVRGKR